jgi:hypothetical protein
MESVNAWYRNVCIACSVAFASPTRRQAQIILFLLGIGLVAFGASPELYAQRFIRYNEARVTESVNAVLTYLEGSFGALVMVAAGIGAIMSAAFGQYRSALSLMVVAVGAFILRSFMATFFNDANITK